jgi:energy-coupling factor transporter ATP-binding protein EcfA2
MLNRLIILNSEIYSKADIELANCDSLQIVGPNNIGKSTLIYALNFLFIIDGREMTFSGNQKGDKATIDWYFPTINTSFIIFEIFKKRIVPALTPKDTVIVASNWWNTHRDIGDLAFKDALRNTLMLLISSDARVVIVGNTPDFILDPYENLAVNIASDTDEIYFRTHPYTESDRLILEVAGELGVKHFLPTEILCKSTELCLFRDTVDYLFFDAGHLSYYGSRKVARALSEKLGLIKR